MISVVRDAEHERRFERMWASFERRLAVATHRLNFAASRLHAVERNVRPTDHDIKILYGESAVGEEDTGKIVEDIKDLGASIDRIEGLHCKASVADDEVYIGSFNPLSTDQYGKARNLHELGVYVRSKEVAERVWDVLSELRGGADG
jgi:phosphatidylserine/phosphatidylglycerophosphate/cardiolipin synthase-like enzyme